MCEDCTSGVRATQAELRKRVNAGINWLDFNAPSNWRDLINLDVLDVNDVCTCILGQVFYHRAQNSDYTWTWYGEKRTHHNGYDYAIRTFFEGSFNSAYTGPLGFSGWDGDTAAIGVTEMWKEVLSNN